MTVAVAATPEAPQPRELPEAMLLGSTPEAAEWVAYAGLGGRYAAAPRGWVRWSGSAWKPCDTGEVNRAVRQSLSGAYDRLLAQRPRPADVMQTLRILDLNWQLGPLLLELRQITMRWS